MPSYTIRQATVADAAAITRHRIEMFREMGELTADEAVVVESASRARLAAQLESGEYLGWLTETSGQVVAGAGVLLHQYYPSRANPRGRPTAYILNVFTETTHRGRSIATDLMLLAEDEFRRRGVSYLVLHASQFGRPIYEKLGWQSTTEMSKML